MFFTLSTTPDNRLPIHNQFGDWVFSCDDGWQCSENTCFKGYNYPNLSHGNFLKFQFAGNDVYLSHDLHRSCPIWWDKENLILTNLLGSGRQIWADETLKIENFQLLSDKIDIYGNFNLSVLKMDTVIDLIIDNLVTKFEELKKSSITPKMFITGGVDTITLLSVAKYTKTKLDIINYEHFDYDIFTNQNIAEIKKNHWAYSQIHHWRDNTVFITGSCGDEFMFRGPQTIALWAAWNDIDLAEILNNSSGYHVGYFKKTLEMTKRQYTEREKIKKLYPSKYDLIHHILDYNANDHQHWHLGNTITWTPFKDLELTKLILSLETDDLMKQIIDATINKKIIEQLWDPGLELLSTTKNHNNRQNLHKLALL